MNKRKQKYTNKYYALSIEMRTTSLLNLNEIILHLFVKLILVW